MGSFRNLCSRPLCARLIAAEAVEDGCSGGIGEVIDRTHGGLGLDPAIPLEIPGGVKESVEGKGFDGALRVEFGGEGILESHEIFVAVLANDEVLRGESVAESVLGDAGLAFDGARAGR